MVWTWAMLPLWSYIMTRKATDTRSINPLPSKYYYSVLYDGYKTFGFDGKILNEAVINEAVIEAAKLIEPFPR